MIWKYFFRRGVRFWSNDLLSDNLENLSLGRGWIMWATGIRGQVPPQRVDDSITIMAEEGRKRKLW